MREETLEEKLERWKKGTVYSYEVAEVVSAILIASHKVQQTAVMTKSRED